MTLLSVLRIPGLLEVLSGFTGDDRLCLWLTALSGRLFHAWRLQRQTAFALFGSFLALQDEAAMEARVAEAERLADEAYDAASDFPPSSPEAHSSTLEMLRALDSEDDCWGL